MFLSGIVYKVELPQKQNLHCTTATTMAQSTEHTLLLLISFIYILNLVSIVDTAGDAYCIDNTCGTVEEVLELHLHEWEKARTATQEEYGAGMYVETIEADVVVAGCGSAGVSAALSAARNGAKVVAVQSRKVLGGNASSESKLNMVGASKGGGRGKPLSIEAREGGIVEEYTLDNCVSNPQQCAQNLDLSMYNLFKLEPNINLILNTDVIAAEKDETNTITQVIAECQASQIRYIIKAKVFIDSTGDGRLGAEAYVPFIIGREGKSVYNESLAVAQSDNETEGSSFAFTSIDTGSPAPFTAPSWARKFTESDFKYRPISNNSLNYGYWWIEISYPYNNIRDNNIEQDLLLQNVLGVWDYIKNSGYYPEAATRALDWFGQFFFFLVKFFCQKFKMNDMQNGGLVNEKEEDLLVNMFRHRMIFCQIYLIMILSLNCIGIGLRMVAGILIYITQKLS